MGKLKTMMSFVFLNLSYGGCGEWILNSLRGLFSFENSIVRWNSCFTDSKSENYLEIMAKK